MSRASKAFEPEPASPGAARAFVRSQVAERDVVDVQLLLLLASELASNAVLHAQTSFRVTVDVEPRRVRVEVADASSTRPRLRSPEPLAPTGRGLRLVADTALAWGVESVGEGKVVWFELPGSVTADAQETSR
jgi:serine/threonine-protein kinase RsbW